MAAVLACGDAKSRDRWVDEIRRAIDGATHRDAAHRAALDESEKEWVVENPVRGGIKARAAKRISSLPKSPGLAATTDDDAVCYELPRLEGCLKKHALGKSTLSNRKSIKTRWFRLEAGVLAYRSPRGPSFDGNATTPRAAIVRTSRGPQR